MERLKDIDPAQIRNTRGLAETVRAHAHEGVRLAGGPELSPEEAGKALALMDAGIAAEKRTMSAARAKGGRANKGVSRPTLRKLTPKQEERIRALHAGGAKWAEIMGAFKISKTLLARTLRGSSSQG